MSRSRRRKAARRDMTVSRRTQPGAAPGLVLADPSSPRPVIHVMAYGSEDFAEFDAATPDAACDQIGKHPLVWINVEGLGDAVAIERFGELLNLHRLSLEDTVNVHQRAKIEDFGNVLFVVLRMVGCGERCNTEQLSMFVGGNYLLTFQEGTPGDSFDRVRGRLREGNGKVRQLGSDYLAYTLIDAAIDNYYPVLEVYAERIDELEDQVLEPGNREVMKRLHEVKSDLLILRRAIWPLRDALAQLGRQDVPRISDYTRVYLRDCYDHVVQVVELIETYRELTADLRDLHMSSVSNRINDTMRVLTIISTIFIPLTFVAGIYGMNFDYFPEIHWRYGYPMAILLMIVSTIGMIIFFYRQGWIFVDRSAEN